MCSILSMSANRSHILGLYKQLLRESQKFSNYNFRNYAMRRVRDAFREARSVSDETKIARLVKNGESNLAVIHRQVTIGALYKESLQVLEALKGKKT